MIIHNIVYPETGLVSHPGAVGFGPLSIGIFQPQIEILPVPGLDVKFKRQRAEYGRVHVLATLWEQGCLRGEKRGKARLEPSGQSPISCDTSKLKTAKPCTDFGVEFSAWACGEGVWRGE